MKKILLLAAVFILFNSCSRDDIGSRYNYSYVTLPIDSVDIPSSFTFGSTYQITLHYKRPSTCHYFYNLYYDKNLNVRTVAVQNVIENRNDCQTLTNNEVTYSFNFLVNSNGGTYVFKFWNGQDANGVDQFLQYTIPVN